MYIRKLLISLALSSIAFVSLGAPLSFSDTTNSLSFSDTTTSLGFSDTRNLVTYFRAGVSRFEPDYQGNSERMLIMRDFLRGLSCDSLSMIDSLVIRAAASPEGTPTFNQQLSDQRTAAIYDQVVAMAPELASKIIICSVGEDWKGLHQAVLDDPDVPYQSEVLNILTLSRTRNIRESFLRVFNDGHPWRYITTNILPNLRSGVLTLVYYRRSDQIKEPVVVANTEVPRDTVYVCQRDTVYVNALAPIISSKIPKQTDNLSKPSSVATATPRRGVFADSTRLYGKSNDRPTWALKTNLLYWAALQGNVEAEFYLGNRWSLNFEYQVAWWSNPARHQYYQYMQCGPEGRYWFKGDGQFRGHYVGIHVGFGLYDLSWGIPKDEQSGQSTYADYQGYQGEFAIALGISYGYVWKIGKTLNLELGLGLGYIMTEYRRYNYQDTHYVYQATERMQFVGPTKARLTLLWQFGRGAGKGTRK